MMADQGDSSNIRLSKICSKVSHDLHRAGVADSVGEARRLIMEAAGLVREDFILSPDRLLESWQLEAIAKWLERRRAGEPLARIRGWQDFYGRRFELSAATLEPRFDTETVIDTALELIDARHGRSYPWRLIDVGTGSGCLAITLLAELPHATATATDISAQAIDTARSNAQLLGVDERCQWKETSYLAGVNGPFDLLISNPPYIKRGEIESLQVEVQQHDPLAALDGGVDGLDGYRAIAREAVGCVPTGFLIFEIAANDEDRVIGAAIEAAGEDRLQAVGVWRDLSGSGRCVALETLC